LLSASAELGVSPVKLNGGGSVLVGILPLFPLPLFVPGTPVAAAVIIFNEFVRLKPNTEDTLNETKETGYLYSDYPRTA